jgi:hypothetical protein
MKKHTVLAPLLILTLITTGCAPLSPTRALQPKTAQAKPPPAKPQELEELMAFINRLDRSTPAELSREYDALMALPEQSRGDDKLLELSLLLSQPGFSLRNDATALQMLQAREQQKNHEDSGLIPLIRWLRSALQERVRLAGSAAECSAQLRDERKRADTCSDKLQAIRKMEDSLIEHNRH